MKATPIFFTFFLLFTSVSIAVPIPFIPGNVISKLFEPQLFEYTTYIEAITNGFTYAFATCLLFFLLEKKLENSKLTT